MLTILAHRGWWQSLEDQNSLDSFERAFKKGFGVETDLRDFQQSIVISHDRVNGNVLSIHELFELHANYPEVQLALNIKEDGLQIELSELIGQYNLANYFVFDMSCPDALGYRKINLPYYTRLSEHEREPQLIDHAAGVWLDSFEGVWFDKEELSRLVDLGKKICWVSPELHGRAQEPEWTKFKMITEDIDHEALSICTDYPVEAREFFDD